VVFDRVSMICIARGETANNPLGRDSLPGPDDHFILAGLIGGQNALPCHDQITPDSPVDARRLQYWECDRRSCESQTVVGRFSDAEETDNSRD